MSIPNVLILVYRIQHFQSLSSQNRVIGVDVHDNAVLVAEFLRPNEQVPCRAESLEIVNDFHSVSHSRVIAFLD